MHEWALAEAVLAAALEAAEKEKLEGVSEVRVKVGELQQVDTEILDFAFSQLKLESFKDAKLVVEIEKAEFRCRVCGHSWIFGKNKIDKDSAEAIHFVPEVAHVYIKCPNCGSPDFEIVKGRGIWLKSLKGVK
jgi:hydrogenase nickel incorporation protein HypA/HybF